MVVRTAFRTITRSAARPAACRPPRTSPGLTRQFHGHDFALVQWPGLRSTALLSTPLVGAFVLALWYESKYPTYSDRSTQESGTVEGPRTKDQATEAGSQVESLMLHNNHGGIVWCHPHKTSAVHTQPGTPEPDIIESSRNARPDTAETQDSVSEQKKPEYIDPEPKTPSQYERGDEPPCQGSECCYVEGYLHGYYEGREHGSHKEYEYGGKQAEKESKRTHRLEEYSKGWQRGFDKDYKDAYFADHTDTSRK